MLKIYHLKVSDYIDYPDAFFKSFLGKDSLGEIEGYSNKAVRRTKMLGESMVRILLKQLFGLEQQGYEICKGEHGKPYIRGCARPVYYNISHSKDYIICAVSDSEVGVDIEYLGTARMNVAARFFHPDEVKKLHETEGKHQDNLFFMYWAAKESFLKYTGTGMSCPLSTFEITFSGDTGSVVKQGIVQKVFVHRCNIDKAYKCFVCSAYAEIPEILKWPGFKE